MALDDKEQAALEAKLKAAEEEAEKWKGLSRKHEDRSKENADAAAELKKLKDAQLSDDERRKASDTETAKTLDDLKRRADEADARALRAEVAAAKKLTPGQAKRLTGATREELEADADDLLENFPSKDDGETSDTETKLRPGTRPKSPVGGGGETGGGETVETDPAKLAASVPRI